MNQKELRIGNLVFGIYDNYDGETCQNICRIMAVDETESLGDGWSTLLERIEGGETEEYDEIKPIPLTEEWLKRFGYAYYNGKASGDMTLDFGGKLDIDFVNGKIQVKSHYEPYSNYRELPHIKFVHQIQNLFYSLSGQELTLSPPQL